VALRLSRWINCSSNEVEKGLEVMASRTYERIWNAAFEYMGVENGATTGCSRAMSEKNAA